MTTKRPPTKRKPRKKTEEAPPPPPPQPVAPPESEEPEEDKGIRCPRCGCRRFDVLATRATWGGRILRRRECEHCGRRITTFERSE